MFTVNNPIEHPYPCRSASDAAVHNREYATVIMLDWANLWDEATSTLARDSEAPSQANLFANARHFTINAETLAINSIARDYTAIMTETRSSRRK
jgi:hypothetical protein